MLCLECGGKTKVTDTVLHPVHTSVVLRRRVCAKCGILLDTAEMVEDVLPPHHPRSRPEKALSQKLKKVRKKNATNIRKA